MFWFFTPAEQKMITLVAGVSGIGSVVFNDEENWLVDDDAKFIYEKVLMPYKATLEEWYVKNRSGGVYFWLIFLTVFVLCTKNKRIIWRVFPTLPEYPRELEARR